jgi:hypothetical protein
MKKAQDYRDHASQCRALAPKARTEEERVQLLSTAETWDGLADERGRIAAMINFHIA